MTSIDRIQIEIDKNKDTIGIAILNKDGAERFSITEDSFRSLFANKYSTGYLSVSQDGPVFIEERLGTKVVVIQRGLRPVQTVLWGAVHGARPMTLTTPWTFFIFRLTPSGTGYLRDKERLFVSGGACRGEATPLCDATFLGNVYGEGRGYGSTNICWGNTAVAPGGLVTVASLTNIANDFYAQQFTNHLERSTARWEEFSKTGRLPVGSHTTLGQVVKEMWGDIV